MISRLLAVSAAACALSVAAVSSAGAGPAVQGLPPQALPPQGILVPGISLGGVHIGDTMARVTKVWGRRYGICPKNVCKGSDVYWEYVYTGPEPLGAAVRFKGGRVVAVFTLGSPRGWRTREGLLIGQGIDDVTKLYGSLPWSVCVGYGAMSMRNSRAVTSIYMTGESVYGFAITSPGTSVCQ